MAIHDDRRLVISAYPGPKWAAKVNKMTDLQIFAILIRLRNAGKIK